jgi:hypothetical protein
MYGKLFYACDVLLAWSRMSKQIFSYHKCVTDGNGYRKKIVRIFPGKDRADIMMATRQHASKRSAQNSNISNPCTPK